MGEVIRKSAPAADIIADVATARRNAASRGGRVAELAEARLAEALGSYETVAARRAALTDEAERLAADARVRDQQADGVVGRVADEIWNALGRPAADTGFALLFPGGIEAYVSAPGDEEPYMLELLAELLDHPVSPKLTAEQRTGWKQQLLDVAAVLRPSVEAANRAARRLRLLDRVGASLARIAQMRLVSYKRDLKGEGLTEVEIHQIIPDAARPHRADPAPAPTTP
jgi:hypothetical protein